MSHCPIVSTQQETQKYHKKTRELTHDNELLFVLAIKEICTVLPTEIIDVPGNIGSGPELLI